MSESTTQNLKNHGRLDPAYHFVLLPILLLNLIYSIVHLVRHLNLHSGWFLVLSLAAFILAFKVRSYALKVQDRVIRLEERLRLSQLLPEPLRSRIPELTEGQLCALRFASDAEIPKLVERTLNEKLSRADIKKAIQNWRPDYWRV